MLSKYCKSIIVKPAVEGVDFFLPFFFGDVDNDDELDEAVSESEMTTLIFLKKK
jgi:hypothetical protein